MNFPSKSMFHVFTLAALLASSIAGALTFTPVQASSPITVNSTGDFVTPADGECSLREAINNANSDSDTTTGDCVSGSGNDTIIFDDALGTAYPSLDSALPIITDAAGLVIDGGTDITINGLHHQAFIISTGTPLSLQNITVLNAQAPNGGAIRNQGMLTIQNSTFSGNAATSGYGGAIWNDHGTLSSTDSTFSSNIAISGGGIFNDHGTLMSTNSTFSSNFATTDSSGYGGAIWNDHGTLINTYSTFFSNFANAYGGGIYNDGGTHTIANSTFSGNEASLNGGAIYNNSGPVSLANSTIQGNSAAYYGGGVYNKLGTLTITNSTFSVNSALRGDGIYNNSELNLYNSILANSINGEDCRFNMYYGTVSGNNNLIEGIDNDACGLINGLNGNIIGFDPNLGALTGTPAYFPLNSSSPAIDAGDDAVCGTTPVNNESQNGGTRPQGSHCDIGSSEMLDTTAPGVLSSVRIDPSPSTASTVQFTVTFSEPVMNVTTDDFSLTAGGVASTSLTSVSGGPSASYTVTVNAGTGDGTLRLDINVSDITDIAGNPLSTGFTSGETYTFDRVPKQRLINGGFNSYPGTSKSPLNWAKNAAFNITTDGKTTAFKKEGSASVTIKGAPGKTKTLTQDITLSGTSGNAFTLSYWTKAAGLPAAGLCQVQVTFYNVAVQVGSPFTLKCPTGATYNWKKVSLPITAPGTYTKVTVKFTYSKSTGTVWFDLVSLIR